MAVPEAEAMAARVPAWGTLAFMDGEIEGAQVEGHLLVRDNRYRVPVEVYAYGCRVEPGHVELAERLPVLMA